jgi:hypothetical protein
VAERITRWRRLNECKCIFKKGELSDVRCVRNDGTKQNAREISLLYSWATHLEIVHVWLPPCIKELKARKKLERRSMKFYVVARNSKFRLGIRFLAKSSFFFFILPSIPFSWEAIKGPARWRRQVRSNTQRKGVVFCIPEHPGLPAKDYLEPRSGCLPYLLLFKFSIANNGTFSNFRWF